MIAAQLEPVSEKRRIPRSRAQAPAKFRERGRTRIDVQLLDLSTHGCKVRADAALVVGSQAWVVLPTLASWRAKVAWSDEQHLGLDFVEPLHPAVADLLIRRAAEVQP